MNRAMVRLTARTVLWVVFAITVAALLWRRGDGWRGLARMAVSPQRVDSLLAVTLPADLPDTSVDLEAFVVHFNPLTHLPNCTAYYLTVPRLTARCERDELFWSDTSVTGCPHVEDYAASGYDRGHMVPAADMAWDSTALSQSFSLVNVCPQLSTLNRGGWARLEQKVREWVARDSVLLVWCGPLPGAAIDTVGADCRIAVPERFFKVVLAPAVVPPRAVAFVYGNRQCNGRLSDYAVSVDSIERLTGFSFFDALPHNSRVKCHVNLDAWLR